MQNISLPRRKCPSNEYITITEFQSINTFLISPYYAPYLNSIIIPNGVIKSRIAQLANEIMDYYGDRPYLIICILKGSIAVFNELVHHISSGYHDGKYNNCVRYECIKLEKPLENPLANEISNKSSILQGLDIDEDKEILLVEDLIETGSSMLRLLDELNQTKPKSIKIFSLLLKEGHPKYPFHVDYVGFLIPKVNIVGFGLDYNQKFRDLLHICELNEAGIEKFKKVKKDEVVKVKENEGHGDGGDSGDNGDGKSII